MWKVEYPGGQHEINRLHIPAGRDVQLLMTSEDVIHDFGLPDFRVKRDVLPGRYEALWLRADKTGSYRLFCDQFCGTDHAAMMGRVIVLSGPDYQRWLEQNDTSQDLVAQGKTLFIRNGCAGCHQAGCAGRWRHRSRAVAERPVHGPGAARGRQHGHRRRSIHPRFDPVSGATGRGELCTR